MVFTRNHKKGLVRLFKTRCAVADARAICGVLIQMAMTSNQINTKHDSEKLRRVGVTKCYLTNVTPITMGVTGCKKPPTARR